MRHDLNHGETSIGSLKASKRNWQAFCAMVVGVF